MAIHLRPAPSTVRDLLSALALASAMSACGQIEAGERDASVFDAGVDGDATRDVAHDHDAAVDRWTPCGEAPEFGLFACCGDGACRGGCYSDETHKNECNCGEIWGGCKPPYVCCGGFGCKTLDECRASGGP